MPKWGLEMTEGTVTKWHLAEGQTGAKGGDLADIETAKIVNTVQLEFDGAMRRQLAKPGETLPVGALIGIVADPGISDAEIDTFVNSFKPVNLGYESGDAPAPPPPPVTAPPAAAPAPVAAPAPAPAAAPFVSALSPAEAEARNAPLSVSPIARRLANKLGIDLTHVKGTGTHGRVSQEDVEAEIARLGAGGAAPSGPALSPADVAAQNDSVAASPIARNLANKLGIDLTKVKGTGTHGRVSQDDVRAAAARLAAPAPVAAAPAPAAAPPAHAPERGPDEVRAGPAARKLAAEMGIDLANQTATGPKNTMLKEDVLRGAAVKPAESAVAGEDFELIPLTPMRKAIAATLVRAKQTIPHFYLSVDFEMDRLIALRAEINAQRGEGEKLSVTDFLLRAVALALAANPDVNIHFTDAGIKRFKSVNLSLAVAIDGGLMTPVIRDAANKSLSQISKSASAIAKAARARTLTNDDMANGTFTISNLGMFGIYDFDAVINPPQGAILATGKTRREAYETAEGGVAFHSVMSATLSCDHRAIDGALGAKFLATLSEKIANPLSLLL
jgi:pyruvate dehydrogenase E2 component (dihydrolipoamide acetyltransferase)